MIDLMAETDMSLDAKREYVNDIVKYVVRVAPIADPNILIKELEKNKFLVEE